MALRVVKDRVKQARGEGGDGNDRVTAKEVWERLVEEMNGQGRQAPSSKTVKRWLDRWVTNGVLVEGKKRIVPGSDKPVTSYTLPPTPSRALSTFQCPLVAPPRNPLQEQGSAMDNGRSPESGVSSFDAAPPDPEGNGHRPEWERVVHSNIPVHEGDLEDQGRMDTKKSTNKGEPHGERQAVQGAAAESEHTEGSGEDRPVGGAVPSGSVAGVSVRGDGADSSLDVRSPIDPDVGGPGSPVQRHDVDVPGLTEWRETGDYDSF